MLIFKSILLFFLWLFRRAKKCKILAIDSNFDTATEMGFDYRNGTVYPWSVFCGYWILRAQGNNANRNYVVSLLNSNQKVLYITGVGHGGYSVYTGQNQTEIFRVGNYNSSEVKDKVIHLLSCQTARDLGPDFVRNGCKAFFGYTENFTFNLEYSHIFFGCDSTIDFNFVLGKNAEQVYTMTKNVYNAGIDYLNDLGHFYVAALLADDLYYLRCPSSDAKWGDKNAHIKIR